MGFACGEGARTSRFLEPSSGSDVLKLGRPGGGPGGGGGGGGGGPGFAVPYRPTEEDAYVFHTSDRLSDPGSLSAAADAAA